MESVERLIENLNDRAVKEKQINKDNITLTMSLTNYEKALDLAKKEKETEHSKELNRAVGQVLEMKKEIEIHKVIFKNLSKQTIIKNKIVQEFELFGVSVNFPNEF